MHPFLYGTLVTVLYIIIAVGVVLPARKLFKIPDELFRKILHFILLGAYIPLCFAFKEWWMATVFSASLMVILFPSLLFAEKIPMFSSFVNERKKGEFKSSMVLAVGMMVVSTLVCWGLFGDKYLVLASIYAWGVGDALAALVGKRFGKHKIKWKLADGKKSVEGSLAMFICALVSVFTVLMIRGGNNIFLCLFIGALAAVVTTVAELCAKNGLDTIICPILAMLVIIPMTSCFNSGDNMEWFWLVIASIGAGVGTGLAGLSAATVMVPMLIVLCPSFSGETGAYQATTVALASDILGSAVTTVTYAKNKNIDIKRSWLIMTCILVMCTVGSYVAFIAGNTVLGGFTLILTFCIGIRFLVKPDTSREDPIQKGSKLGWKEVILSLACGIPIGFGTGFVGTGGGMMMLIVFTVFFGMELKTAVGTSTFIMTFTALIASVSHVMIHPAIVFENWDTMLLCIVVATVASLVSARFANRVSNKTIGLATGVVLTLLGATMIVLNYFVI